jgi:2-octaprenyl-6-methoxyphenol hydroxylase
MTAARAACDVDCLIVGGGLVGASLACALARHLRVAIVEATPFSISARPGYDDRSIALAYGTRRIFEGMGLWPALAAAATPIERIHVSDRGHFGATRLRAADYDYEALGYVVESRVLGQVFADALRALPQVELICPGRVEAIEMAPAHARVTLVHEDQTRVLTTRLLVGADGAESGVRRWAGIGALRSEYGQSAVIANLTPERPHGNVAYERFTDSGPLALLPLSDRRCALVWTVRTEHCAAALALSDEEFLARLQERFGGRLGRLQRVGARTAYPLALVRARRYTAARIALIGNAAHTLHPIAGQGFNLGLRDVAALAEVVCDAAGNGGGNGAGDGHDAGAAAVLARYEEWRRHDQRHVLRVTDGLVRLFSNDHTPLAVARGAGLVLTDLLPPLKRAMMRRAMGLAGRQPRLARGLPL